MNSNPEGEWADGRKGEPGMSDSVWLGIAILFAMGVIVWGLARSDYYVDDFIDDIDNDEDYKP